MREILFFSVFQKVSQTHRNCFVVYCQYDKIRKQKNLSFLYSGCAMREVFLPKHPVLSRKEQCTCCLWMNVDGCNKINCTWRLEADPQRNTVTSQMYEVSNFFFPSHHWVYDTQAICGLTWFKMVPLLMQWGLVLVLKMCLASSGQTKRAQSFGLDGGSRSKTTISGLSSAGCSKKSDIAITSLMYSGN